MKMLERAGFSSEAAMCAAFIAGLPKGWVAYPETANFDIVLVRQADGAQIGIEAKLKLNGKVIAQAAEETRSYEANRGGPDYRAVLIPTGVSQELSPLCLYLGIAVISIRPPDKWSRGFDISHQLPALDGRSSYGEDGAEWWDHCPTKRLTLPEYVPDVRAGASAPSSLTAWKIGAIKLTILLGRRGYLTREDFAHYRISFPRWRTEGWLIPGGVRGQFVRGQYCPDFRLQHPRNHAEIEADYEKWKRADSASGLPLAPPAAAE